MLLVSFSLWNDTTFCIHCSPVDGESGWMYIRLGISGSAFPATIHRLDIQNTQNANGSRVIESHSRPFTILTSIRFQELQNNRRNFKWNMTERSTSLILKYFYCSKYQISELLQNGKLNQAGSRLVCWNAVSEASLTELFMKAHLCLTKRREYIFQHSAKLLVFWGVSVSKIYILTFEDYKNYFQVNNKLNKVFL